MTAKLYATGFLTNKSKSRIVRLNAKGKGATEIVHILAEDDLKVGRWSVITFLKRYQDRQSLENAPRSGRPAREVILEMMNFLDTEMETNDEMTAPELTRGINDQIETRFSQPKIKRLRQKLDWVCTKTKYCQLIREPNCIKRLEFSQKCLQDDEQFEDVIFTDECSVVLENHTKILFHREWEQPNLKGRPKHPLKVHVWGGISKRGATKLLIFDGIMDAGFYVSEILSNGLLPFIRKAYRRTSLPAGQRSQTYKQMSHHLYGGE